MALNQERAANKCFQFVYLSEIQKIVAKYLSLILYCFFRVVFRCRLILAKYSRPGFYCSENVYSAACFGHDCAIVLAHVYKVLSYARNLQSSIRK